MGVTRPLLNRPDRFHIFLCLTGVPLLCESEMGDRKNRILPMIVCLFLEAGRDQDLLKLLARRCLPHQERWLAMSSPPLWNGCHSTVGHAPLEHFTTSQQLRNIVQRER